MVKLYRKNVADVSDVLVQYQYFCMSNRCGDANHFMLVGGKTRAVPGG